MNTPSAMDNLTLLANHSECHVGDSTSRRRPFLFFYLAVIIAAIPSNVFSLYVSWQHIRQRNELGVYVFNLAVSDLAFTACLSLWLDFLWRGVWVHGGYVCVLSICVLFTNFYTSEAFLCCIAVDRYLAVVHPMKYASLRGVGPAAAASAAVWVLVVCVNASTITWKDSYRESKRSACFDVFLPQSPNAAQANVARFFLGLVVPLLLVASSTWGTCVAVRSNKATDRRERRWISKVLGVVLLCLLFCFGPVHLMMLLRSLVRDCGDVAKLFYPYKISIAVSCLNCLADPFLYCFLTRTGRETLSQVVLFFRGEQRRTDGSVV